MRFSLATKVFFPDCVVLTLDTRKGSICQRLDAVSGQFLWRAGEPNRSLRRLSLSLWTAECFLMATPGGAEIEEGGSSSLFLL